MSRSSKTATATAAAPRARASTPPLRRSGSSTAGSNTSHLTSQRIAADLAAFKKSGGRIEVLGNTPLRPYSARTTTRRTTPAKKP